MSEHTPTPWTSKLYESQMILYGPGKIQVLATSWHSSMRSRYPLKAESIANAEFALKAVNSHEALVKALGAAREYLESDVADGFRPAERLTAEIDQALGVVGTGKQP